ncbi:transmembrane protein 216 isoform X1 [Astatotilapia calliptera]|uniref:transmembrane protein 216 isoform X1 n=2 Tax=Astatotilapia calliptera TaxID=8154 RepID=UPI000E3FBC73|nr:transmembrane protein 216-like isoform X1 [Astatotilapia calliptera]
MRRTNQTVSTATGPKRTWRPRANQSYPSPDSNGELQVLFYLNSWYFAAFYLAEVLMFIYKGVLLPYPSDNLVLDVVLLLLFLALEILRIFYGWKGNLCERSLASCVSLFVLLPCTALAVYYLLLQTFILRLEFLLNAVLLCFYGLEFLLGLISISAFSRAKVY